MGGVEEVTSYFTVADPVLPNLAVLADEPLHQLQMRLCDAAPAAVVPRGPEFREFILVQDVFHVVFDQTRDFSTCPGNNRVPWDVLTSQADFIDVQYSIEYCFVYL